MIEPMIIPSAIPALFEKAGVTPIHGIFSWGNPSRACIVSMYTRAMGLAIDDIPNYIKWSIARGWDLTPKAYKGEVDHYAKDDPQKEIVMGHYYAVGVLARQIVDRSTIGPVRSYKEF